MQVTEISEAARAGVSEAAAEPQALRVLHVIAGLDPAHGGPSYSVPSLCRALAAGGAEARIFSLASRRDEGADRPATGFGPQCFPQDFARVPILRDLRASRALSRALREGTAAAHVVHDHGLWLMPNLEAGWAARRSSKPLVVSPRGMLAPAALAYSPLRKRIFWRFLQGPAIRRVASFHATSEQEYEEIRAFGLLQPVAVIPNGIDLPQPASGAIATPERERIVLSLGRIHPKKGLDRLLVAWARIEAARPGWRLAILGPAEANHDAELIALSRSLGLSRVSIAGPVYGEAKDRIYRAATLFILATANENFGLTVAEALAAELPVIATTGTPWARLEAEGCGWWVEPQSEALASALRRATALPRARLEAMGAKGRAWMAREFSWPRIGRDMLDLYRWLCGEGPAPPSVRLT